VTLDAGRSRTYDAIIVGAGPAGLALALRLGRRMEVALVERRSIGWAKPCAGMLCDEAYRELVSLGVAEGYFEEPPRLDLEVVVGGRSLPPKPFWNIDRRALGRAMRALLPPSVALYEGFECRLDRLGEGFSAILVSPLAGRGGSPTERIEAPRLIAADGVGSATRRFLGLAPVSTIGVRQSFHRGTLDRACFVIDPEVSEEYYYWLVPKAGGAIFGSAAEGGAARRSLADARRRYPSVFGDCVQPNSLQSTREARYTQVAEGDCVQPNTLQSTREARYTQVAEGDCVQPNTLQSTREARYAISKPAGKGEIALAVGGGFLIGEAAGLVMPSSGEGLSYAFASARALGEAMAGAEGGGVGAERAAYAEAMRDLVDAIGLDAERGMPAPRRP
jgi:flavin-dependent dehydrogenase